jgi:hypothetical protein
MFLVVFGSSGGCFGSADDAIGRLQAAVTRASRLTIVHEPYRSRTFVALTPELIEKTAKYRITINRRESPAVFDQLGVAMSKTSRVGGSVAPDLRWGCRLYGSDGRLLGSFFIEGPYRSRSGEMGIFDGVRLAVNHKLLDWFEASFPEAAHM